MVDNPTVEKTIHDVLTKETKFILAPMVDQSELAWRLLARRYGAQICFTPMFNANVISKDATYRKRVLKDISCPDDRPLIVQFCANTPEQLLCAGKIVEQHCDAIDLNLGCPQHIAKRGHFGSFLQDSWELLARMISTCKNHLSIPITAKIRVFPDVEKTVQYAKMLEAAGCSMITVHGRTKEQKGLHTGLADWSQIKEVKENLTIPVISNGNIQDLEDIYSCLEKTGVDGVMVAESHLTNPCIFVGSNPGVYDIVCEYLELVKKYPCPISYVRAHLFKIWVHAFKHFPEYQERLGRARTLDEMESFNETMNIVCKNAESASKDLEDKLPYWICQPHVRERKSSTHHENETEKDVEGAISRNQQKKLARYQRKVENLKLRRQFERDRRKERRAGLKACHSDSQDSGVYSTSNLAKAQINSKLTQVMENDNCCLKVCLDLSWTDKMSDKEISKLAGQIGRLYGCNRKSARPASLHFTSFSSDSKLYEQCSRKHNGFENYKISMTEDEFSAVFDENKVIYLSPDGEEELDTVDTDHVYIMGGLVDETIKKHLSRDKAAHRGITAKRLPITSMMHRSGHHSNYSTVLAINQVFGILLTYHCTKSWREALSEGMPPRKGYLVNEDVT